MKGLIINFPALNMGGIESFIFNLANYSLEQNYKVIWLCRYPIQISKAFESLLSKVETVEAHRNIFGIWKCNDINLEQDIEYTMISFTPFDHEGALQFASKYSKYCINPLYIIANTKGRYYFVEENYYGILRNYYKKRVRKIHERWIQEDYIRSFTDLQLKAIEDQYDLKICEKKSKLVPNIDHLQPMDMDNLFNRTSRRPFNLVTVSRFDFPHKNYLLGLIDDFKTLKTKYPFLKLHIVGYGQDENIVVQKVKSLPHEIAIDVKMYGQLSAEQINELMKDMHLNISVAGSVGCGAKNGVLSIPARNFCEDICEVYGFLPESINMTTSTVKGSLALPFIEDVINMSAEEYIQKTQNSYKAYTDRKVDPCYLFNQARVNATTNKTERFIFSIMSMFKDVSYKLHELLNKKEKAHE